MNLIERLGGYERAKIIQGSREMGGLPYDLDLEDALLQYRRQHNIFESDDLVASKKWVDGSIHKIELVDSEDRTLKIFSHDMAFSYWVDSRNYRHATDAEIKAGKRLEVKSEN